MAHDVLIAGALFHDVPSVQLPDSQQQWHSFTDVSDTTAAAADVAQGKQFYDASGVLTQGTSSGGGGASNVVTGEFTAQATNGVQTINVPYSGNGYPIMVSIWVKGGLSDTTWKSKLQMYAMAIWSTYKSRTDIAPTYTSGDAALGTVAAIYRTNSTSGTTYSTSNASAAVFPFRNSTPTGSSTANVVFICDDTTIKVCASNNSYGFMPDITYEYVVVYSE